ncbi:MAG: RNA-binding domain-containing protein [Nitrososphaera sp.]
MSEELKFSGAEAHLVLHATEDEHKVLGAIQDVLSIPASRFTGEPCEGHFKNRILLLRASIPSEEAAELAARIASLLSSTDRMELQRDMHNYSDEKGNLYLRLDKQRLCRGSVALATNDSLRIRFRPVKKYRPTWDLEHYRRLLSSTE